MRKLMLSLARFRLAFRVMSAYRDVAAVVTGPMGVSGRDIRTNFWVTGKGESSRRRKVRVIWTDLDLADGEKRKGASSRRLRQVKEEKDNSFLRREKDLRD
ncbi:Uncharacterized protein TCM_003584 [Theobroma cacao]|uniref:Uncharacterized protein n=1 Tax=Theobroma cacao TaxID=3641 RepID=A0A061DQ51_THECC|nr:Uncharacterized protein TCM_003584 [Theobroma cacao]